MKRGVHAIYNGVLYRMAASSREPQHPKARPARGVIGHSIDTSKSKTLMTRGRGLA